MDNNVNASSPRAGNTCAIITLYHPGYELLEHLEAIMPQVHHIILIINDCSKDILTALSEKLTDLDRHSILINQTNLGLAHALNQGLGLAYSTGMEWALLLDQDTRVNNDILAELAKAIASMPGIPVILGSNYRDVHGGTPAFKCKLPNRLYQSKPTVITSGTLLNIERARYIGSFRSEYFIDSIDHEYCMRARSLGHEIYITCKPLMIHSIGLQNDTLRNRLQCLLSHPHQPQRKYYVARNSIANARYFAGRFPLWALRQLLRVVADMASTLLFEDHKYQRIKYSLSGLLDGIQNRFKPGPLETGHA